MYQADNDLRRYFDNNSGRLLYKWLHYFEIYDHHFRRYRGKPVNILEIGVYHGGSLQLWKNYFGPQATIYGVDIDPRCKQFEEENVKIFIGDQSDRNFLSKLRKEIPRPDILIDDGGHTMIQQITTFEELYPFVADDGIYLCEDLHTSYWPEWGGGLRRPGTFIEFSKQLVDSLNGFFIKSPESPSSFPITKNAHSLHFYDSVLVIEKQRRDSPPQDARSGTAVFPEGSIGGIPQPSVTLAVLTPDHRGGSRVEERLFIPNTFEASRFKLAYGGWKESGKFKYNDEVIHGADGYLIHGQFPEKYSSDVLEHIFSSGKPVIYFFDESLPELSSGELRTKSGFRKYLSESLKLAHLVVVESDAHKKAYQSINPRILVLPHNLEASLYSQVPEKPQEKLKIIYQGSEGHLNNLLLISKDLKRAADQFPDKLEFHFFGRGLAALDKHPAFHFHAEPILRQEWDEAIRSIQPGLALMPLLNGEIQELTSIATLLEYNAYGIPVIASNVAPYHGLVKPGHTGLLAENDVGAWFTALEECLKNPNARTLMGKQARQWLTDEHALTEGNGGLSQAFEQLMSNAANARPGKPPVDFMHLNDKSAYQTWLSSQQLQPRDVCWMENEMGSWKQPPRFHLLMTLLPGQMQWLNETLDSLVTQINPQWQLSIVAFTPQPTDFPIEDRIYWYEVGDDEDSYDALNRLANNDTFDWVCFIESGDRLPTQALFKLALHARQNPEWQVIYTDEDQISADSSLSNPLFKPDYNPDLFHGYHYTGGLCLFDRKLYSALDGVNGELDGSEVYDLLLRCTEQIPASAIGHLAEILYTRFELGGHSMRSWQEISQSSEQSLREHYTRRGIGAEVRQGPYMGTRAVVYPLDQTPLVSILITSHNSPEQIKACVEGILNKTDYPNYELLILDAAVQDDGSVDYFDGLSDHPRIRVLDCPHPIGFSAICNFGAQHANGDFLLLLSQDTEVPSAQWLTEMMRHGLRPEVGVVGARLLYPNGTLRHAGLIMGSDTVFHPFIGANPDHPGYMMRAQFAQNYLAVTGACMLVRKDLYTSLGGFDEVELANFYGDADFCLRVREKGKWIVFTPNATLIHKSSPNTMNQHGSFNNSEHLLQKAHEQDVMLQRWVDFIAFDPSYNRNLSQTSSNFEVERNPALAWDPNWHPAPRILAYPGDEAGCGEYRIFSPCRALNKAGLVQAHAGTKLFSPTELAKINPDVFVLQRMREEQIMQIKKHSQAFRIYEVDDMLHALPPSSIHWDEVHGNELEITIEGISLCDRLVTTTPVLADVYGRYCQDVKIIPNYLEHAKWGQLSPTRQQGKKPRIGWAGGSSHSGDLKLLYPVIQALYKEVDWIFFGMCPELLRPFIHEYHMGVKLDFYPAKLASLNLDLALAPLEQHPFNEAKSALKILEYGALGYPVICTDIVTYQGGFPVTRVSNRPQDWIEAIRHAISDRDTLAAQGDALRMHIRENWMLEDNLDKWLEAWLP